MRKKILITGGNGYVGRELTRVLYPRHEVALVDSLRHGRVRFRDDELDKFHLECLDINDGSAVAKFVATFSPDVIVHLAAIHFIPECEDDPSGAVETNVVGTQGNRVKKFKLRRGLRGSRRPKRRFCA